MSTLKSRLIRLAEELGFAKIGFAAAKVLQDEYDNFGRWLEAGMNADMSWLERNREKRQNPSLVLENAKTVIITAFNYYTPYKHEDTADGSKGKLSRYAWGDDYQELILPKLKILAGEIASSADGAESKCYVDTGPVLERQWAMLAGIGWQGKNGNILTKEFGSWIFLSTIITTVEFEPDKPMENFCGKCTKCLDACPTGAIIRPKVVDARKCLAYWTIEAKPDKVIPDDIAQNARGWLYGCDICQDVCPWNRKPVNSKEQAFLPRKGETSLDLQQIMNITKDEYNERFRRSPVKRAKLEGLKRNIRDIFGKAKV